MMFILGNQSYVCWAVCPQPEGDTVLQEEEATRANPSTRRKEPR
jgi:hypothetical protein